MMLDTVTTAWRSFLASCPAENSVYAIWKTTGSLSTAMIDEIVPFWRVMAIVCVVMLLGSLLFVFKKRVVRAAIGVLSACVYALPIAALFVNDPQRALQDSASITVVITIVWFLIGNWLLYPHMGCFVRLLLSYIHFMIVLFPPLMAQEASDAVAFAVAWFLPVAFHIFVYLIPLLPEGNGGAEDPFNLNDMTGDEFDDYYAEDM